MPIKARINPSMVKVGRRQWQHVVAKNSTVSWNAAPELDEGDENRISGMVERWLSASAMPTGIEATMPTTDTTSVTSNPPAAAIDLAASAAIEADDGDDGGDADEDRQIDGSGATSAEPERQHWHHHRGRREIGQTE